ncbi:CbtA family protein [Haloarcula salinisoli]|uniref:CbtA family protein n=1 Tax=Haloarcula salinisoli TaxID=2487746 RepID=A0A8J7YQC3_9EURY|nr:CbtA family protein [Halomicroarcula salinisoli]MBX0288285.1 CbtA family protein [Halomicroarcula salinisoli]MBX0305946.1 CbtA family protein [Halomicroarcula salinisoli]
MATDYLERGALAGLVGGLGYGLFQATVGNSFTAGLETFESGHSHSGGPVVDGLTTAAVSVGGGVLWGLLFGIAVFGVGYYFLEPVLPGRAVTQRLTLAAAGFLTVSGAPWLVLPPQPPGVEQALATDTRMALYAGMMAVGALVAAACVVAYRQTAHRHPAIRALATGLPLVVLSVPVALAPANAVSGPVPVTLAAAYRWTVVFGQAGLWAIIAAVHSWLGEPALVADETEFPTTAD